MSSFISLKRFNTVKEAFKTCLVSMNNRRSFPSNIKQHSFIHAVNNRHPLSSNVEHCIFTHPSWIESEKRLSHVSLHIPPSLYSSLLSVKRDLTRIGAEANHDIWERKGKFSVPSGMKMFFDQKGRSTYLPIIVRYKRTEEERELFNSLYVPDVEKGIYIHVDNEEMNIYTFSEKEEEEEKNLIEAF